MTTTQTQATSYDPAALYAKWTESAKDTRWRYRDATVGEFYAAVDRADAWSDGAAHVHTVEDIAAYLAERIQREDTKRGARETYADMLNDVHTSGVETVALAETIARIAALEAEVEALRAQLQAPQDV